METLRNEQALSLTIVSFSGKIFLLITGRIRCAACQGEWTSSLSPECM